MKLDITDHHFIELQKKGYTIDMVLILSWANKGLSLEHIINGSKKIEAIHKTMLRKDLLTEEGKPTKIGIEILEFVRTKTKKKFMKPVVTYTTDFDEWWDIFPTTDIFTYKGRKFEGSRSLRVDKDRCRMYFNKMIIDQEFTKEEIINATLYDVYTKKKNSVRVNKNNLTFLSASPAYLNQKKFIPFIPYGKPPEENDDGKVKQYGSVDI